jgi:histone deacetylase 1/2
VVLDIKKSHKLPSSLYHNLPISLDLILCDVWGPSSIESACGFRYFFTCVYAHNRFTWIYLLQRKSDVFNTFQIFKTMVEKQFEKTTKSVQTDGGGEFKILTHFLQRKIVHRVTCPYTHHQNGTTERKHRQIIELGLALHNQSTPPLSFWDHSFLTGTYLINRLPLTSFNNTFPYKVLHQRDPDYKFLSVFGCSCFPNLRPYNQHMLQLRSIECVFLGYSPTHKGYKCLSIEGRIYISKDVVFNKDSFPYNTLFSPSLVHCYLVSALILLIHILMHLQCTFILLLLRILHSNQVYLPLRHFLLPNLNWLLLLLFLFILNLPLSLFNLLRLLKNPFLLVFLI